MWPQMGNSTQRCVFLYELCKCMSVIAMGKMLGGLIISI